MRLLALAIVLPGSLMAASGFDQSLADRFFRLALDCVHKEYPNKIAHSLNSDADVKPPRELTPGRFKPLKSSLAATPGDLAAKRQA